MRTVKLLVRGRVQGVGYRDWAVGEALSLGISGWVRNRRDGAVEMLAAGDAQAVQQLEALVRRGPAFARVDEVAVEEADEEAPAGFARRPTF